MRLLGKILQEQRVHRAFEAHMQVRDLAFAKRHDANAKERQSFEESGRVLLIAAKSIQGFGEHDVEFALERAAHQRLKARSQQRRPGDGVIVELVGDLPTFALGERAADPNLIRDGSLALVV